MAQSMNARAVGPKAEAGLEKIWLYFLAGRILTVEAGFPAPNTFTRDCRLLQGDNSSFPQSGDGEHRGGRGETSCST